MKFKKPFLPLTITLFFLLASAEKGFTLGHPIVELSPDAKANVIIPLALVGADGKPVGMVEVDEETTLQIRANSEVFNNTPPKNINDKFYLDPRWERPARYIRWFLRREEPFLSTKVPVKKQGDLFEYTLEEPGDCSLHINIDGGMSWQNAEGGRDFNMMSSGDGFVVKVRDITPPVFHQIEIKAGEKGSVQRIQHTEFPLNKKEEKTAKVTYQGDHFSPKPKDKTNYFIIPLKSTSKTQSISVGAGERSASLFYPSGTTLHIKALAMDNYLLDSSQWRFIQKDNGSETQIGSSNPEKIKLQKPNYPSLKFRKNPETLLQFEAHDKAGNKTFLEMRINITE